MKLRLTKLCDALVPVDEATWSWYAGLEEGDEVELELVPRKATPPQRRAMWLYLARLAASLNDAGFDQRTFPFSKGISIPWTKESVMSVFWRPIQDKLFDKASTRQLTTTEVRDIHMILDKAISERTGVTVPFPTKELME